jgi:hypothetical protein
MTNRLCTSHHYCLDGHEDDALAGRLPEALQHHWQGCSVCQEAMVLHQRYLAQMAKQTAPVLTSDKKQALLDRVIGPQRFQWRAFAYGNLAAAAVLVTGFLLFQWVWQPSLTGGEGVATAPRAPAWQAVHTVPVVIIVPADMVAAELALTLPQGYALEGLEGLSRLQWQLDLKAGHNIIQLPVTFPSPETLGQPFEVVAELRYQANVKTFTMTLNGPVDADPKDSHRSEAAASQNVKPV